MNFQAIDQADGKNVAIWATLTSWEGIAFTPNQAKYLSCKLKDDNNIEHKCRIYEGKGTLPGQEHLNNRMQFSVGSYQGNYKGQPYTGYSGFWSHGATASAPQNQQQAPSQAPQSTNPQQQGNNDNDVGIRTGLVCAYISNGTKPLAEDIEYWMEYCKTGKDASLPGNVNTEHTDGRPATDSDVPF